MCHFFFSLNDENPFFNQLHVKKETTDKKQRFKDVFVLRKRNVKLIHQNEKWGYFMDSGQFYLTNFNWKKFSKQLESLKNLKTLIIRSCETKIYNCKLPDSIEKIRVQDGIQFDIIFPQSQQKIVLHPDAQKHAENILSLPNIEDCSFFIPSLDLPDIDSTIKKSNCNPQKLAKISSYKRLEELHIHVKEEVKPEITELQNIPSQK